ncbi:thioredoxin domain-containing protein [Dactylosporangium cerinum]
MDRETWLREREALLPREKAHTREGDAIAAARRRLPMTEIEPIALVGAGGPTPLAEIFQGRDQLVVYKHMWHEGLPFEAQCEGCTASIWDFHDAAYLEARGVSFAVFGEGPFAEMAPFKEFMGYTHDWYSTYGVDDPAYAGGGILACYLRQGDRFFLTYESTGRGVEAIMASHKLLDLTVYGRQEVWEDSPEGWPQEPTYTRWRRDGRPVPQWTRPAVTPVHAHNPQHCH